MEKGSLQKHSPSSRKLGRQEGDGGLGAVAGSLGLAPGKSKLKDKLSAIRQDRAERRESLQKQDAIHEVDSSEDETDEGSEDSQDGRRGTTFTPPPLLRPTTVRTGPGGTLPSLCLSPCTPHATFSHVLGRPAPSHTLPSLAEAKPGQSASSPGVKDTRSASSTEDGAGQERKVLGTSGTTKLSQGPLPFSTPGSAFISVSKDTFLKPGPPQDSKSLMRKTTAPEDQTLDSPRTTVPSTTTSTPDCRTTDTQETPRASCSSPGVSKEKKEADNRRLCAAAAASLGASSSSPSGSSSSSSSPVPAPESAVDKVVSQLATVAKSILVPGKLGVALDKSQKDQKPSRGGTPEVPAPDPVSVPSRQLQSPTASPRSTKPSAPKDCKAPPPQPYKAAPERPTSGSVVSASPALNTNPGSSTTSEPKRKRSDPQTIPAAANAAAAASSQHDKATSKKT